MGGLEDPTDVVVVDTCTRELVCVCVCVCVCARGSTASAVHASRFAIPCHRSESGEDAAAAAHDSPGADDVIRTRAIDLSEELGGAASEGVGVPGGSDPTASPSVASRRDVRRPDDWDHVAGCACCRCRDLVATALDVKFFTLQVRCWGL